MRTIKNTRDFKGKKLMGRLVAAIICVVGFLISIPFVTNVMMAEHEPYMSFARFMFTLMLIVGLPMFFGGFIAFFIVGKSGTDYISNDQSDMGRIRHAVEMERMKGK